MFYFNFYKEKNNNEFIIYITAKLRELSTAVSTYLFYMFIYYMFIFHLQLDSEDFIP